MKNAKALSPSMIVKMYTSETQFPTPAIHGIGIYPLEEIIRYNKDECFVDECIENDMKMHLLCSRVFNSN